jgi:hypothetical protein
LPESSNENILGINQVINLLENGPLIPHPSLIVSLLWNLK